MGEMFQGETAFPPSHLLLGMISWNVNQEAPLGEITHLAVSLTNNYSGVLISSKYIFLNLRKCRLTCLKNVTNLYFCWSMKYRQLTCNEILQLFSSLN